MECKKCLNTFWNRNDSTLDLNGEDRSSQWRPAFTVNTLWEGTMQPELYLCDLSVCIFANSIINYQIFFWLVHIPQNKSCRAESPKPTYVSSRADAVCGNVESLILVFWESLIFPMVIFRLRALSWAPLVWCRMWYIMDQETCGPRHWHGSVQAKALPK